GTATRTPVVCLQHFRGGLDNWDPNVTDGLAKDRPVILFNNAGVASSGGDPADTVTGMARHVIAFVDALGLKKVDLLGFSLGGFVAQQVVLESPDLIRHVILAGTGAQGGEGMDHMPPKVVEHATREKPILEDFLYLFFRRARRARPRGVPSGNADTRVWTKTSRLRWRRWALRETQLPPGASFLNWIG